MVGTSQGASITNNGGNFIGSAGSPVDPRLAALADNGGATKTHALFTGSPAHNGGDPSLVSGTGNTPFYDQRGPGFDRVLGPAIDIGAYEGARLKGDFSGDFILDVDDLDALIQVISAGSHNPSFDLTGDRIVDLADRDAWLAIAGEANLGPGQTYLLGDANLDSHVDGQDFVAWNAQKFSSGGLWSGGDFNGDGVTDGQDFVIWNENKFDSADLAVVSPSWNSGRATAFRELGTDDQDERHSAASLVETVFEQVCARRSGRFM